MMPWCGDVVRSMPMSPTKSLQRKMLNCCDRRDIENHSFMTSQRGASTNVPYPKIVWNQRVWYGVLHQPPLSLRPVITQWPVFWILVCCGGVCWLVGSCWSYWIVDGHCFSNMLSWIVFLQGCYCLKWWMVISFLQWWERGTFKANRKPRL